LKAGRRAAFLLSPTLQAKDADDYNSTNLPPLPNWAGLYQIDLESISPDQNWAILVPKDPQTGGNYLVHLPDFVQILDLPTIGMFADRSREGGLMVHWARDSSAVVAFTSGKFGAENIFLVVPGSPGYLIDLEHAIRREMQADFEASKAESWNCNFDYHLEGGSWTINDSGQVIVDCQGDSNPRENTGIVSWIGHFQGLYDIRTEKFITRSYNRVFCGKYGSE
jgi:hypothetical protein